MTNDYLIKKVFHSYLLISILAIMASTIGMIVDGIVIGQFLGEKCVSAFGFSGPVVILIAALAGVFSNGGSSVFSNHVGRGDMGRIRLNFTVTCIGTLVIGIFFTVVSLFFSEPFARILGAEGELTALTAEYIRGFGAGGIFIMLSQVLLIYVRSDNSSVLGFVSVLVMTAVNITLDFVLGVALDLGMFGMGLATAVSYLACMLVCLIHFFKKDNRLKLSGLKGGAGEFKDVVLTGIPSALNRGCMTLRGVLLNHLLMTMGGSMAVSALAVQNNVNQFLSSVTMGIGMTVMLIAGIFFGERDEASLGKTLRVALRTGFIASSVVSLLVIIFARPVVGMFLDTGEAGMALAVRSLRFFCVSIPFSLVCVVLLYFYQCTRNLFMANYICIAHGLAFVVIYAFALAPFMGTDGVWVAFIFAELTTLLTGAVIAGVRRKGFPRRIGDVMLLPKSFEPHQERMLNLSIKNDMEQVMELSERIGAFCSKYSNDGEKIRKLSLCIEEMAGNVVEHGFRDQKTHWIDIKIIMEEDDIILRMRDNGIPFNPAASELKEEQYGIAMIRGLAKEITYKNAVGMNNLMITV